MNTALQPTGLMIDLLTYPDWTPLNNKKPLFSWVVNDSEPSSYQEAFQILVSSNEALILKDTGDMWDTGVPQPGKAWASENRSLHIPYEGCDLASNQEYWWKVRTWNGVDNISPWSEPCRFMTGLLNEEYGTQSAPLTTTEIKPVSVVQTSEESWFIDFGKAAFGTIKLMVDSPDNRTVQINLGEVVRAPYVMNREPGGSRRYKEFSLEIESGKQTVQVIIPPDPRNTKSFAITMPQDMFEVYPFRYCEVTGYPGILKKENISQICVHTPFNEKASAFTSSSKTLNDVWELCKYTMKSTSFCGYYVDGDRERIPYEADAYINQLGHYGCDREYAMARKTHEYLLTTPTWPTEWILDSVLLAWNDYLYTGCAASLTHYYEDLKAKTLTSLAREDGLITLENMNENILRAIHFEGTSSDQFQSGIRDIVDWPEVERDGHEMLPVNSAVNTFHYRAVSLMEKIARALGKTDDVHWYRERGKLIHDSFRNKLIDPATGLVLDGLGSTHSSLHANMTALAFGLVKEENKRQVGEFLKSRGMACSVYASQFLLEALYEAGEADFALSLLSGTGERSWAHMIYDVGTTIALEAWDNRLKPNQDWNHAWGAAPAGVIPRHLMGIRPGAAGFERIIIQPQPGSLEWAEMTTPTIRGPVTVRFNNRPGKSFHLETETPANTTSDITLPLVGSQDPTVVVDGRRVTGRIDKMGITVTGIGSGHHSFDR
jgi:alpha-L-rhamnosidase